MSETDTNQQVRVGYDDNPASGETAPTISVDGWTFEFARIVDPAEWPFTEVYRCETPHGSAADAVFDHVDRVWVAHLSLHPRSPKMRELRYVWSEQPTALDAVNVLVTALRGCGLASGDTDF